MRLVLLLAAILLLTVPAVGAENSLETDTITTSQGDLKIHFLGHGSLSFTFDGKNIYVDPWGKYYDYAKLPKADLILITHEHQDHLDTDAIHKLTTHETKVILTEKAREKAGKDLGTIMRNGDTLTEKGLKIEAVPAYNIVHMRNPGEPFHPKGNGNGYVITFGDKRVYVGGDTENIPETKKLHDIDIAFLPMNLPYTMTPEMVVDAAQSLNPKILYPYHTGESFVKELDKLKTKMPSIDVRIRKMNQS